MVRFQGQMCVVAVGAVLVGLGAMTHGATIAPFDVSTRADANAVATSAPYLGIRLHSLTRQMADELIVPDTVKSGAVVTQVYPHSPAQRAGVRTGDVIVGLDDAQVGSASQLALAVRCRSVGDQVQIHLVRGGTVEVLSARLAQRHVGRERTCDLFELATKDTF